MLGHKLAPPTILITNNVNNMNNGKITNHSITITNLNKKSISTLVYNKFQKNNYVNPKKWVTYVNTFQFSGSEFQDFVIEAKAIPSKELFNLNGELLFKESSIASANVNNKFFSKIIDQHVIFIIDTSLAMLKNHEGTTISRLQYLKNALKETINKMNSQNYFSIIVFNNDAQIKFPYSQATQQNKNLAKTAIENIYASIGVNLNSALELAKNIINNYKAQPVQQVIILSATKVYNINNGNNNYLNTISEINNLGVRTNLVSLNNNP